MKWGCDGVVSGALERFIYVEDVFARGVFGVVSLCFSFTTVLDTDNGW